MANVDLLFAFPPVSGSPAPLVFGELEPPPAISDSILSGAIAIARPAPGGRVRLGVGLGGGFTFPRPTVLSAVVRYSTDTARPLVGTMQTFYEDAALQQSSTAVLYRDSRRLPAPAGGVFADAIPVDREATIRFVDSQRVRRGTEGVFEEGNPLGTGSRDSFVDSLRLPLYSSSRFEEGEGLRAGTTSPFQDTNRQVRGFLRAVEQEARSFRAAVQSFEGRGLSLRIRYENTLFEEAMPPRSGRSWYPPGPPPPGPTGCYTPDPDLLFELPFAGGTSHLVFRCDPETPDPEVPGQIIVPVRRIYMTVNSLDLRRVDGGVSFPTTGFSLQVDVDSWTWSWSATCSKAALALLDPGAGELVEMEAEINGSLYRLYAEEVSLSRTFGEATVNISGRGLAAEITDPVAPTLNFSSAFARTANQLATEALQINGVGIGWSVDWGLVDWLVPGGVWSHQGTHLTAVQAIVAAAGGYIQPTPTSRTLRVLHRAPVPSWGWSEVVPDVVLPSDPVTVEGIRWTKTADYNRVFVSGQAQGVLGQVTRTGTAGEVLSGMVVDPLITHADAALQRGRSILSAGGRQALVSLTLPLLSETGFILPGTFLQYVDNGVSRKGIVRSSSLAWDRPRLRQTLAVETHEVA